MRPQALWARRAALGLALSGAFAANAGPPFLTGDPDPVDRGHWEISVGVADERRPGENLYSLPAAEFNYGIAENFEMSLEGAWLRRRADGEPTRSGGDNPIVGLKWRILEEEKNGVSLAIKPEWAFRNSSSARKGLADDESTFALDVRVQKTLGGVQFGVAMARVMPRESEKGWEYGTFAKVETGQGHTFGIELHGEGTNDQFSRALLVNLGAQIKMNEGGKLLVGLGREVRNRDEEKMTLRAYLGWQLAF